MQIFQRIDSLHSGDIIIPNLNMTSRHHDLYFLLSRNKIINHHGRTDAAPRSRHQFICISFSGFFFSYCWYVPHLYDQLMLSISPISASSIPSEIPIGCDIRCLLPIDATSDTLLGMVDRKVNPTLLFVGLKDASHHPKCSKRNHIDPRYVDEKKCKMSWQ